LNRKKAKGRVEPLPAPAARQDRPERDLVIGDQFQRDLEHWVRVEPRMALRVLDLMEDVKRSPFEGKGKPEPLKHNLQGMWSRRITDEHRLVYEVLPDRVTFVSARFHY
jgi:toxin YoeB